MRLWRFLSSFPRTLYIAGAVLWAAVILIVLLLPSSSVPRLRIPHADKAVHAGMFFVLAYFLWYALVHNFQRKAWHFPALGTFLIASGYGALTEYIQLSAATRTADVFDALADAAGAAAFLLSIWVVTKRTALSRDES